MKSWHEMYDPWSGRCGFKPPSGRTWGVLSIYLSQTWTKNVFTSGSSGSCTTASIHNLASCSCWSSYLAAICNNTTSCNSHTCWMFQYRTHTNKGKKKCIKELKQGIFHPKSALLIHVYINIQFTFLHKSHSSCVTYISILQSYLGLLQIYPYTAHRPQCLVYIYTV